MNVPLLLAVALFAAEPGHLDTNPVYKQIVEEGVCVPGDVRVKLPAPTVADGLSAAGARAAIEALPNRHVAVDLFLRKSVVAPQVFRLRKIEMEGATVPVQAVDVWCVAYGKFEVLKSKEFLDQLLDTGQRDAKVRLLTAEELEKRGIAPPAKDDRHERYAHSVFPLMDRVELEVTPRTFVSRTKESLVFATMLDPRFADDKEFPNRWRPKKRDAEGKWQFGAFQPYSGSASYLKVTPLAEPAGALFLEYHLVFTEPKGWFSGANLLRSKLPMLIQSEVRKFRRQLSKASQ